MNFQVLTRWFRLVCLLGILPFTLSAQTPFPGDLSIYQRGIKSGLENFYAMIVYSPAELAANTDIAQNVRETLIFEEGVFTPDYMEYHSDAAVYSLENYLTRLSEHYGQFIENGVPEFSVSQVKLLSAVMTDDKQGIIVNVIYQVDFSSEGNTLYKGRSQAAVVFPNLTNKVDMKIKQITPYKGDLSAVPPARPPRNKPRPASPPVTEPRPTSTPAPAIVPSGEAVSLYEQGLEEERHFNYDKSVNLYQRAAELGSPAAMVKLGLFYENGYGDAVQKDFRKAFNYYKSAAACGYPDGLYHLGICYRSGRGTVKNLTVARKYLKMAAELGHGKAIKTLRNM